MWKLHDLARLGVNLLFSKILRYMVLSENDISVRRELMKITLDVGRITVQEYMCTIPGKFLKLHIFVLFKGFVDKVAILKELRAHKTRKIQ